jgi:pimeloyl-ACP methyl ester carboxylesterase
MESVLIIDGKEVFCRDSGSGKPVMLVHGFGEDGTIWENQVPALEKQFRVIIPDLPGSGRSALTDDVSMEGMAEVLKQVLDELGITSCVMIGHSMGGYVALAFAEKYDEYLQALGLFHSTSFADNEEKINARQRGIEFIHENGAAKFIEQTTRNLFSDTFKAQHPDTVQEIIDRFTNFLPQSLVRYYEAMINRPDRTGLLRSWQKPALFIMGLHDKAVPMEQTLQQCHLPVLSYIHILKDSGHMGMLEESETSRGLLVDFLLNYEIV